MIEITRLSKIGGPLTKSISLRSDGRLISDGSACLMSCGSAQRVKFDSLQEIASYISDLGSHDAIAIGALRADLPDRVQITTKKHLQELNGTAAPDLIARTGDYIRFKGGTPAIALIDIDTKGMPPEVKIRIDALGGYWPALLSVVPGLDHAGRITRRSTSAGIARSDTGEQLSETGGAHIYILIADGADTERFLRTLHERCWLHGLAWLMVGAGGQLLDRSLVDRMVYAPERLVFEGAPVLSPPLIQDQESRRANVRDGEPLDTLSTVPPLRIVEQHRLETLRATAAHRLAADRAHAREKFIVKHAPHISQRSGISFSAARRTAERLCEGVLLSGVELPFDNEEFVGCTVDDVLNDPERFVGATLADPLEGVPYGRCKAKIMSGADGTLWIHSFAHGRTAYELKYGCPAVEAIIRKASAGDVVHAFVEAVLKADISNQELERLRSVVCEIGSVGKRVVDRAVDDAKKRQQAGRARDARIQRAAERRDPRPQFPAPSAYAPWLPQMQVLNDVLGKSNMAEPPARDIDGVVTQVRVRRIPNMHAFNQSSANEGEAKESRQPATEQPLLSRLDETQLAELIEQHIDYQDPGGRSVHLAPAFVKHFHTRIDDEPNALPTVLAIATLPIVLPDGTLLSKRGLDRDRGIVFRVPPPLLEVLPFREECTRSAVADAMRLLCDEWLVDVSTDFAGKCILIAAALTIVERSVLPERPAFFVTAGRRGGGKTTALIMLMVAVTGMRPAAAAWSTNEEERRKSLLSYLMEGLPAIIWDNIPRGTPIRCPHIEKSCTAAFYSDRRLGVSEAVAVSASTIQLFTGNNVMPAGDLASRSLKVRLEVNRPDPENRQFMHPDPVGWTEDNRPVILRALYTILLGNPESSSTTPPQTRFKMWWRVVGSAVEHASAEYAKNVGERVDALVMDGPTRMLASVSFRDLFLSQEDDDEESRSLGEALDALAGKWPSASPFKAAEVAKLINDRSEYQVDAERTLTLREFLFPRVPANQDVSSKSVGKALKRHLGEPVRGGGRTLTLKEWRDPHTDVFNYFVKVDS